MVVDGSARTLWSVGTDGRTVKRIPQPTPQLGTVIVTPHKPTMRSCVGPVCYRIFTGQLRVERSEDGGATFRTDWEISGTGYDRLVADYGAFDNPAGHLSSAEVLARPVPGGHVVFVANRRDGLLYRNSAGRWQRLGIPDGSDTPYLAAPPPLRPGADIAGQVAGAAGGVVLLAAGWAIARRRSVRPIRAILAAGIATVIAITGYVASGLPDLRSVPAAVYATFIVVAATIGGAATAVFVVTGPEKPAP
jgi:hypothetical protein